MRIIAGRLRGKTVNPPAGYKARPTTDFAKEGLFNTLDNEFFFDDLAVLDLFGGTGSISFEFASRGAGSVIAVEMNPANAAFISRTAATLGLRDTVQVVHHNVFDFLDLCVKRFDIVVAAGDRLLLCNSFPAADEVTAQYFLFAALHQFQVNPEVTTVHFFGEADEAVKGDLFRHFASVEVL